MQNSSLDVRPVGSGILTFPLSLANSVRYSLAEFLKSAETTHFCKKQIWHYRLNHTNMFQLQSKKKKNTNYTIPNSMVLLKKLIITWLVKKFHINRTQNLITTLTAICQRLFIILSQWQQFHTFPPYFLKIHLNIIFPFTFWSPKLHFSFGFTH